MTTFVIGDTHFSHANLLRFKQRDGVTPVRDFVNVQHMNEHICDMWNSTVGEKDTVWHLGDVYWEDGWKYLKRLKGIKHLIIGNHDNIKSPNLYNAFRKIKVTHKWNELGVILSHYPLHASVFDDKIKTNVHGHIHSNDWMTEGDARYVNVSVEVTDYTPVEIVEAIL